MLGARSEVQKKDVWRLTKKKREERLKGVYIKAKRQIGERMEKGGWDWEKMK